MEMPVLASVCSESHQIGLRIYYYLTTVPSRRKDWLGDLGMFSYRCIWLPHFSNGILGLLLVCKAISRVLQVLTI